MKLFAAFVVFLGIIMTTVTGFNIVSRKRVVDIGSLEVTRKEKTPVYWSPLTGGFLVVTGVVMLSLGKKKF